MRTFEDTYRHKGLRKKLTDVIRTKGINDEKILEAIGRIPRHFFLDSAFEPGKFSFILYTIRDRKAVTDYLERSFPNFSKRKLSESLAKPPCILFKDVSKQTAQAIVT